MPQTEGCALDTVFSSRARIAGDPIAVWSNQLKAPCDRADAVGLPGQVMILMILLSVMAPAAGAQDVFMYPARGQSQQQQDRDRYECHSWAVAQTGFDPSRASAAPAPPPPPPPPQQEAPQGGLLRGGARGAAIGAVGGAIGGDAGKGAAIGAATGAMIGGIRRREQMQRQAQQQSSYQQQQATAQANQSSANAAQRDKYNRAMTACLQGRGYTVN
jgi:hypothetical protein